MDLQEKEFRAFGKNIENISIYYGIFLILWGLFISLLSKSSSMTSYIPSFLGVAISVFSYLSIAFPSKKKLFMHVVVLIGLITLLGGLDLARTLISGSFFSNFWADLSKLMMLITGSYFVYLCVQSFRFARMMKKENN